jgi:hypothetical protein
MPPILTNNMSLTVWDTDDDFFDGSQLANNFTLLDQHDHDQSQGRGVQINSPGIADGAIGTSKLATDSVTPVKIVDHSITGQELADNAIASQHVQANAITTSKIPDGAITPVKIDPNFLPIGSVISWYRPNGSISLPTGWEVCDGRNWSDIANAWGVTTGTIPNLVNKFVLGAALSGIGTGPSTPPDIGAAGGSHTRDLSHSHTVSDHMHSVDAHAHGIVIDGSHKHRFATTIWDGSGNPIGSGFTDGSQRGTAVPGAAGSRQSFFVPELNRGEYYGESVPAPMETVAGHAHGGATTTNGSNTSVATGVTTNTWTATGTDLRPAFVGFLYIMRVRNS